MFHATNKPFVNDTKNPIELLIENGADIHSMDDYSLRYASQTGHIDVVKYLLKKGAKIHKINYYYLYY